MAHKLKIWPQYFQDVISGVKTFEIRRDDRDFQVGDNVVLREWDPEGRQYTGRAVTGVIIYILRDDIGFGICEGYCVFGMDIYRGG
jgi:hypothetical protein